MFSLEQSSFRSGTDNVIDYYAKSFVMIVTDDQGFQKHRLKAVSMNHFRGNETTKLEKPLLTIFNQKNPPWVIRSDTGTVSSDGEHIFLGGKVFIDRDSTKTLRPINIITKNLQVEPEKRIAETNERVDIISLSNKLSGVGMRVDFAGPINLTLVSKVRGRYEAR